MSRRTKRRGCGAALPPLALVLGLSGCGWGLALGMWRGGEQVSAAMGWSFWVGWGCGLSLFAFGLVLFLLQRMLGAAGNLIEERTKGAGQNALPDALPDLGFLENLFRR